MSLTHRTGDGTKYRKRPVVIEAFQMTEQSFTGVPDKWPSWLEAAWNTPRNVRGSLQYVNVGDELPDGHPDAIEVVTLEGNHRVTWGDYIIQGVQGELYPCKPDIFEATYEKV